MSARPAIAAAMIVKDEAANLPQCLASISPLADEVCVVDTGSADGTPAIAESLGCQVAHFDWCDDFAAARNASLRLCSAEWIVVVDADERVALEDVAALRALAEGPPGNCYRLTTRNYTNRETVAGFCYNDPNALHGQGFAGWFPSTKVRFFQNLPGVHFTGEVHETPLPSLEALGITTVSAPFPIHHYPPDFEEPQAERKRQFYLKLGLDKVKRAPDDPQAHAELANQYADMRRYPEAIAAYQKALRLAPEAADLLKGLGCMLHLVDRNDEAAHALELALGLKPTMAEGWRNLGVIRGEQGDWAQAVSCFQNALQHEPGWADGWRYLAVALQQTGRLQEAYEAACHAIEAHDNAAARQLHRDLLAGLSVNGEPTQSKS